MKTGRHVIQALLLLSLWLGGMMAVQAQTRTVHSYYTDPQGTVLAKTDAQGNILARYDYTPYGGSVASLGSPPDGPGYTGHVNDPETGLVYMQARYYLPIGRFLSPDPVRPAPGNLFSFNRYAYANNNPIVNTDPTGAFPGDVDECSHTAYPCSVTTFASGGGGGDVETTGGAQSTPQSSSTSASGSSSDSSSSAASQMAKQLGTAVVSASASKSAGNAVGGVQTIDIENPIFSFPGFPFIRAIKLSRSTFEGHIKPRHAFDVGDSNAGRFQRSILNRTTSMDQFSSALAAMINSGEVVPAPYAGVPGGLRLFVTLPGSIGVTPSGATTPTVIIGLHSVGTPGVYEIDTAFPAGK